VKLQGASALDDTDQDHHDGNDQENMDESSHRIRGKHPDQPQNDQDNGNSLKHLTPSFYNRKRQSNRKILKTAEIGKKLDADFCLTLD
jgi:hypothetical protein